MGGTLFFDEMGGWEMVEMIGLRTTRFEKSVKMGHC